MNQLCILLLALWSAFNSSDAWDPDEHATADTWQMGSGMDISAYEYDLESNGALLLKFLSPPPPQADSPVPSPDSENYFPEPNITVYRQMEDREHVMVLCKFAEIFKHRDQSFELSVESELNYTIEPLEFSPLHSSEMRVFMVTVSPPASFTCVHEIDFDLDVRNLRSQTYNYSESVSDHREEAASSLYICFSSFIAVGLFIMTAAVIVTNIRSKTKDTNSTAVTNNDYVEA